MALAILFASFAKELHQVMIRWTNNQQKIICMHNLLFQLRYTLWSRLWYGPRDKCAHGENPRLFVQDGIFEYIVRGALNKGGLAGN